jgi:ribosomal protein S18 acetylase RimI-like enzyme
MARAAEPEQPIAIVAARTQGDLAEAAELFRAYAASLPIDLAYQGFAEELAHLPGQYASPRGVILLARTPDGRAIGCVAMRPLPGGACEMKRLYVAPAGRGLGAGRALAGAAIVAASRAGHREMRLDTLPTLAPALALYRDLGFAPVAPYYDTPIAGTIFLAKALTGSPA